MSLGAVLRMGIRALLRNKLRTILTMLGIIIGVGAVICIVAIGEGGTDQIQQAIRNLGDNMVSVEAGNVTQGGVRLGTQSTKTLTVEDAKAIENQIALVHNVSPMVNSGGQVIFGNQNWSTTIQGVSPVFLQVRRWTIQSGSMFLSRDVDAAANVCVLGQTVVEQLFGKADPVGQTIRVKQLPCYIVGVLAAKGLSPTGQDQDDTLMMPYTTVQKKIRGIDWLDDIVCSAISLQAMGPAQKQITVLLRNRHKLRHDEPDDFNLRSPTAFAEAQAQAQKVMTLLLTSIAAVSLVVGGIGIMNIMLVSVTERTREIGVRMAVGATEQDVQLQFLSEAVVLSLIGGAIGIFAGSAGSLLVSSFLRWPTLIRADAIGIAFLFSAAVGIFFGYYPARKAASLDPIEALRYE